LISKSSVIACPRTIVAARCLEPEDDALLDRISEKCHVDPRNS
jgi:hypothetical protein